MRLRSGDIEVSGADGNAIRVSCELNSPAQAKNVTIAFTGKETGGELRISGGPNDDARFRVEIPRTVNLFVRAPAGNLTVTGVAGSKDIEIHAGELTIEVGNAGDYRHADGSVLAGDLKADVFGVTKDGLFRSFNKDNPAGKYQLHAHVGAGDLTLR